MSFVSDIWLDSVAVHEGVECCAEGHCQWFVARGELAFVADGIEGVATAGDVGAAEGGGVGGGWQR